MGIDPSTRAILAAFAAVALAFVASTAYTEVRLRAIDDGAHDLVTRTLPRIDEVTALRSDLRNVEGAAEDVVDASGPATKERLERARGRLDGDVATGFATANPEDDSIRRALQEVDGCVSRVVQNAMRRDADGARHTLDADLRPAISRADARARQIIEGSAQSADVLAGSLAEVRHRSLRAAVLLDALSACLAVLAALAVTRTVRRYTSLLREHALLVEARAVELEQFAGRVAHDIVSPLSVVTLAVACARTRGTDEQTSRAMARGEASVRRVTAIVHGLLDFARSGAHPAPGARANVREVVDDVLEELGPSAAAASISLVAEVPPALEVACGPGVLMSLVANLVRNAIKYMGHAAYRSVRVSVTEDGRRARMEVRDTGPGLPPGLGDLIFEAYVRGAGESQPGLGLGLATVKRIAVAHCGSVQARSEPGGGATFVVELPVAVKALTSPRPSPLLLRSVDDRFELPTRGA